MTEERKARFGEVLRRSQPDVTVVMENIHDPHNVSAMLRSCDAAGIRKVHLVYTTDDFPDIGKKSSASAKKWVGRVKHASVSDCYAELHSSGFAVYATRLDKGAKQLYDLDLTRPAAFVFGNEHRGVSEDAASSADASVFIPMMGMIQSLNVSVACAVTLFEVVRQRLRAGMYDSARMSEEEMGKIMKEWLTRDDVHRIPEQYRTARR
jgi:tRNA (guanosine-2'-O-)-methyltransferase